APGRPEPAERGRRAALPRRPSRRHRGRRRPRRAAGAGGTARAAPPPRRPSAAALPAVPVLAVAAPVAFSAVVLVGALVLLDRGGELGGRAVGELQLHGDLGAGLQVLAEVHQHDVVGAGLQQVRAVCGDRESALLLLHHRVAVLARGDLVQLGPARRRGGGGGDGGLRRGVVDQLAEDAGHAVLLGDRLDPGVLYRDGRA